MKRTDVRKLNKEAQQQLRELIIQMRKQGKTRKEISESLGVSDSLIDKVAKLYRQGGSKGIRLRKRGRPKDKKLTREQEKLMDNG